MAKIFPDPISPDTDSSAEQKMYLLFRDHLSDDYTVMHGCRWIGKNRDGSLKEGECDFIILHPERGALCVEVKGGGIRVDTSTGKEIWYSKDRNGDEHQLSRSPVLQAQDSQYALRDKLSDDKRTSNHWSNVSQSVRWAVCFPDVSVPAGYSYGANLISDLIIDGTKTSDIQKVVEDIFLYWHGKNGLSKQHQPGRRGIDALVDLLAPSWQLKSIKSITYADTIRNLDKLTEDQFIVLHQLTGSKRAIVSGGAGTGKTLLAMELASRLVQSGDKTLYMCFNRNLADWVKTQIGTPSNLEVVTFNELVMQYTKRANLDWNPPADIETLFEEYLPNILSNAIALIDDHYDAIVVDEGQDFRPLWWITIEDILHPEAGKLYIFHDDNQSIYVAPSELPIKLDKQLPLYTNCRNTRNIHDAFQPYTTGKTICNADPGPSVEIIAIGSDNLFTILKTILLELVDKEKVDTNEITILTSRSKSQSIWTEGLELGTLTLTWDLNLAKKHRNLIGVSTIYSYKGLENTVIVLSEMDSANRERQTELAYIGISRACAQIIVLGDLP
jgi:hypothetical protein